MGDLRPYVTVVLLVNSVMPRTSRISPHRRGYGYDVRYFLHLCLRIMCLNVLRGFDSCSEVTQAIGCVQTNKADIASGEDVSSSVCILYSLAVELPVSYPSVHCPVTGLCQAEAIAVAYPCSLACNGPSHRRWSRERLLLIHLHLPVAFMFLTNTTRKIRAGDMGARASGFRDTTGLITDQPPPRRASSKNKVSRHPSVVRRAQVREL